MKLLSVILLAVEIIVGSIPGAAATCESLHALTLPDTTITAQRIAAGRSSTDALSNCWSLSRFHLHLSESSFGVLSDRRCHQALERLPRSSLKLGCPSPTGTARFMGGNGGMAGSVRDWCFLVLLRS
jgi:hypothetical protein